MTTVDTETVIPEHLSFSLAPTVRSGAVFRGGVTRTRRKFLDFVIGGRPLLPLLDGADVVSVLATDLPASDLHAEVGRLLLDTPSRLPGRRHPLYPSARSVATSAAEQ